jgi:AcrR family transcriptional regulator
LKRLFEMGVFGFPGIKREIVATAETVSKASETVSSEDPKERILSAAGEVFAERGFESSTVRDICLAAGVNVAAVNYYFGDKQSLYHEAVRQAHQRLVAQVPLSPWPDGTPAEVKLRDFIGNVLERMLGFGRPRWQTRLMLREVLHPTDACRDLVEDYIRPQFQLLVSILDDLTGGQSSQPQLRRLAMGIIGQMFIYRAAGDVVGMLVPDDERAALHTPVPLADHITSCALAALGLAPPLTTSESRA